MVIKLINILQVIIQLHTLNFLNHQIKLILTYFYLYIIYINKKLHLEGLDPSTFGS